MTSKDEQFLEQVSAVDTDYKSISNNLILENIQKSINSPKSGWSDTCHSDVHSENGHHDSHTDSHPDCGGSDELLGNSSE